MADNSRATKGGQMTRYGHPMARSLSVAREDVRAL
jgi:hypothetical protein